MGGGQVHLYKREFATHFLRLRLTIVDFIDRPDLEEMFSSLVVVPRGRAQWIVYFYRGLLDPGLVLTTLAASLLGHALDGLESLVFWELVRHICVATLQFHALLTLLLCRHFKLLAIC